MFFCVNSKTIAATTMIVFFDERDENYYYANFNVNPPSKVTTCPVIADELAINTIVSATSSGVINFFNAVADKKAFFRSLGYAVNLGVLTKPGEMAFTQMFGARCLARVFVKLIKAAFEAE